VVNVTQFGSSTTPNKTGQKEKDFSKLKSEKRPYEDPQS
jgi:hypothetical protein